MIYPTLHFNYNNSDYAVIKLVDTNLPDGKASLFSMMFENDQETTIMFMNLLSTFITQAEIFYENGWYDGFDDGLLASNDDDDEKK
nr:MAG TPA: hypothetical protein [Caudoviricetes sp.]